MILLNIKKVENNVYHEHTLKSVVRQVYLTLATSKRKLNNISCLEY